MRGIKESDWKRLRDLKPLAVERFCVRVLDDIQRVSSDTALTPHERYCAIFQLIHKRDKDIRHIFDDLTRSNAISRLQLMHGEQLLTEDEMAAFSEEARAAADSWLRFLNERDD